MDNPLTNPPEFQRWKESPLTAAYLQYLKDYQTSLAKAWAAGEPLTREHQVQAETLGDLADLTCSQVRAFYDLGPEG